MHDDSPTSGEREGLAASNPQGSDATTNDVTSYDIGEQQRAELARRFKYHAPKGDQPVRYNALRTAAYDLAELIMRSVPPGREQSLALTKLEEAIMHANSGIARGE